MSFGIENYDLVFLTKGYKKTKRRLRKGCKRLRKGCKKAARSSEAILYLIIYR